MRWAELEIRGSAIHSLNETPFYTELQGRDGLPCRVWKNPSNHEFTNAVTQATKSSLSGLRGLIAKNDLYVWQSVNLLHIDFERDAAISGMRIALKTNQLHVNDETVDQPEHFPWIFNNLPTIAEVDMEDRRKIVETWLSSFNRLKRIYPTGFKVIWYS